MENLVPRFGRFCALTDRDRPDLLQRFHSDVWMLDTRRYGIVSRLVARSGTTVAELGAAVLQKLLRQEQCGSETLGAVVLSSRVYDVEDVARDAVRRAGLPCSAFGIERACSGFPAATELAVEICRDQQRPVAVVTAELISPSINWEPPQGTPDDHTRARGQASKLFGDGAAAVLVRPDGAGHRILHAWHGEVPDDEQLIQKTDVENTVDPFGTTRPGATACMTMPGRRGLLLVKRAPAIMADSVLRTLQETLGSRMPTTAVLEHVVPHQANRLITDRLREELQRRLAPPPTVWDCIEHAGNTVSASIPLAMARVQDQLPADAWVAMPSVGAGGPGYRPHVLSTGCVLIATGRS